MAYDGEIKDREILEMVEVTPGDKAKKLGTEYDQRDMVRMGRKQQLRRQFEFFSITGYAVILGCSWEFAMINLVVTLTNGGMAGSIYSVLVASCGMFFVQLSFAEMASIAPTSGGQYHWCSEFAPKRVQKALSFFVGIFSMLGWQTSLAAVCYAAGQQIVALAYLGNSSFISTNWEISLISFAILALVILANTVLFRNLPLIEGTIMILHCLAFFAFIVVLAVMAPRAKSSEVFTNFKGEGWQNSGVAFLTALTGPAAYLSSADSAVHLAEEVKDAARVVPRAMIVTAITNYVLAFGIVVTLVFSLGDKAVLDSPIGQPYLAIVLNATHCKAATMVLAVLILILVTSCAVNGLTTISRQIWSFARDDGPPFSRWLSVVSPRFEIPLNAISVSILCSVILNLIAIGSDIAYNMLLSLNVSGLMTSYLICVACIFYRRNWGEPLPVSRFNLGHHGGNIVNIISMLFLALIWLFQFFPPAPNPTPADMNWGVVIYGFVVITSAIYYVLRAKHKYKGPVVYVRKDL